MNAKTRKRDRQLIEQYGDAYEDMYAAFLKHNYDRSVLYFSLSPSPL
jgi:hypothetical protein